MSPAAETEEGPPNARDWRLLALFGLPILLGLAGRLIKGGWWLTDLDAVACAAWRVSHHLPPYAQGLACPGGRPAAYMYLPQLAWLTAPLAAGPSISGLRLVFGLFHLGIVLVLFQTLFVRPIEGAPFRVRAPLLVLTTGSALACGNLAFLSHALVVGAGLTRRHRPWILAGVIVLVSILKPVFLTYLLVFAYEDQPLAVRARRIAIVLALAAAAGAAILATGGEGLVPWREALNQVVLGQQTGVGFLDWAAKLGLRGDEPVTQVLFVIFAGLVSLAGLAIAETRKLGAQARLFLALGVAQIANPRLMDYDLMMLAPALAIVVATAPESQRVLLRRAVLAICGLVLLLNLAEATRAAIRWGPGLLSLVVVAAGVAAVAGRLREARALRPA